MKRIFVILMVMLMAFSISAQATISGTSDFTYKSDETYTNVTEIDFSAPLAGPISASVLQSIYTTNGTVSADWAQLNLSYALGGFTASVRLTNYLRAKLAYSLNVSDFVTIAPFIYYTEITSPVEGSGNFHAELGITKGIAFIPSLTSVTTFAGNELIDEPVFSVDEVVGYQIGEKEYVKPYVNVGYNFSTELYYLNAGIKTSFISGLVFNFNYNVVDSLWYLAANISF